MTELAVLDFETTGLVPGQDEVLQVAVVDETGAVLMNEYCRPQRHTAWADAQKVNGIAPQDVCGKPPFEALVPRLQEILSGARRVVAYNDGFEKAFLDAYGIPSRGLRWGEDPMAAFAQQMGGQKRSLSAVASFFGYEFEAHDALADVRATLYLYERLADGGLLRWATRNASPAWGQSPRGPVAYQTLPPEDMLRLLKCLGLCPLTAAQARQLWYKGIYTASPRPCEIVGFQNRSKEDGWLVVAVEADGMTYLVCDDYLREMQAPAFGGDGAAATVPGRGDGTDRAPVPGRYSRAWKSGRRGKQPLRGLCPQECSPEERGGKPECRPLQPVLRQSRRIYRRHGDAPGRSSPGGCGAGRPCEERRFPQDGLSGRGRAGPGAGGRGRAQRQGGKGRRSERKRPGKNRDPGRSRLSRPAGAGARAVSFVRRLLSGKNVRLNARARVRRQLGHPMRSISIKMATGCFGAMRPVPGRRPLR